MARLLALDECTISLRNSILRSLRISDEAVILPEAELSAETGGYKNITFKLSGDEPQVPQEIFSPNWFTGVSAVKLPEKAVAKILSHPEEQQRCLAALRAAIPSEVESPTLQVGPSLDADEADRDNELWECGFDSASCFVGLFTAEHSAPPEVGRHGMNRAHVSTWLVCKAGSGRAGAMFQTRLIAALKKGGTLDDCLERGDPGPQALRRVTLAGSRNRSRILLLAAQAIGIDDAVETAPDQSSKGRYRAAVPTIDTNANTVAKMDSTGHKSQWLYTTGTSGSHSHGLVALSNIADGVLVFLSSDGDVRQSLRNEAFCSLPFASARIASDKDILKQAVLEHKRVLSNEVDFAHPDHHFIRERFTWKNRQFSKTGDAPVADVEPLCLWGSHNNENFVSKFSRELGVADSNLIRLRPKVVCLAGVDSGKLRAALRSLQSES